MNGQKQNGILLTKAAVWTSGDQQDVILIAEFHCCLGLGECVNLSNG